MATQREKPSVDPVEEQLSFDHSNRRKFQYFLPKSSLLY